MRIRVFQLSWLAALFGLLIFFPIVVRCDAVTDTASGEKNEAVAESNNEEGSGDGSGDESGSGSGDSEDEDETEEDLYFYLFDKESAVIEYKAPADKEAKDEPDFLYNPEPGHIRLVEFYAHWCPHCKHFRSHVNKFAKQMKGIAERTNIKFDVYAVSCVPHRPLCRAKDIHGYPRIFLFLGNGGKDEKGIEIDPLELHTFEIMRIISEKSGTDTSAALAMIGAMKEEEEEESSNNLENGAVTTGNEDSDAFWIHKTKFQTYSDIHLSFDFAMKHGIFVGKDPPNDTVQDAFGDWMELLNHALPPSWPLQGMITDIYKNMTSDKNTTTVMDSEENLMKIVEKYPPPKKTWSRSCSRGDPISGYTCGLWQLFHTAAIGVVEWNSNVVEDADSLFYRPKEVGDILRNYVEHFFGCEVCRTNFLHEYDDCGFRRCDRLIPDIGDIDDWKELPLWLFEVHNGVNQRLMKERAEREHREPTQEELTAVEWPARNDCPKCWHADGRFDIDAVYAFLKLSYWPDELFFGEDKRDLEIATGRRKIEELEDQIESWVYSLVGLILASSLLTVVSRRAQKQREIQRTGKHKKKDDDSFA